MIRGRPVRSQQIRHSIGGRRNQEGTGKLEGVLLEFSGQGFKRLRSGGAQLCQRLPHRLYLCVVESGIDENSGFRHEAIAEDFARHRGAPLSEIQGRPPVRSRLLNHPMLGFTVPRAFGKAVLRNRVKRRLREALRVRLMEVAPEWDIVINPRRPAIAFGSSAPPCTTRDHRRRARRRQIDARAQPV